MHLQNYTLISKIKNNLNIYKNTVKKPARGALKKDYLVPSGRYSEQWDWDAFLLEWLLQTKFLPKRFISKTGH